MPRHMQRFDFLENKKAQKSVVASISKSKLAFIVDCNLNNRAEPRHVQLVICSFLFFDGSENKLLFSLSNNKNVKKKTSGDCPLARCNGIAEEKNCFQKMFSCVFFRFTYRIDFEARCNYFYLELAGNKRKTSRRITKK